MSFSSKRSPHSGQNFGGFVGSGGTQPHLSHLYLGAAAGLGFPQFEQNLVVFVEPHSQVHETGSTFAGADPPFFAPQFEQKLVVLEAPQLEHTHVSGGAGFFVPQPEQKLFVMGFAALQDGHVHVAVLAPPAGAPPGGVGCC